MTAAFARPGQWQDCRTGWLQAEPSREGREVDSVGQEMGWPGLAPHWLEVVQEPEEGQTGLWGSQPSAGSYFT